jgi:hypothetical protein
VLRLRRYKSGHFNGLESGKRATAHIFYAARNGSNDISPSFCKLRVLRLSDLATVSIPAFQSLSLLFFLSSLSSSQNRGVDDVIRHGAVRLDFKYLRLVTVPVLVLTRRVYLELTTRASRLLAPVYPLRCQQIPANTSKYMPRETSTKAIV